MAFPDEDPESKFPPDDPDLLKNRSILQRAIVISAGVIANIIFAYSLLFTQASPEALSFVAQELVRVCSYFRRFEQHPCIPALGCYSRGPYSQHLQFVPRGLNILKRCCVSVCCTYAGGYTRGARDLFQARRGCA